MNSRGLCAVCYRAFMARMKRRGLNVARTTIKEQIEDVLPGTRRQIQERLGVTERSIQWEIARLRKAEKVHVIGHAPPIAHTGPWQEVFAWGKGIDATPDRAAQEAYAAHRRAMRKPASFAALLAPLMQS